jgi:alpha-glucosidase (family GH31 glycosyl hydrolase)
MRRGLAVGLLWSAALLWGAPPRAGNTFSLAFPDGSGQIEWITPTTFRFLRSWTAAAPAKDASDAAPLDIWSDDSGETYGFRSRYLVVRVAKSGERITIRAMVGTALADCGLRLEGGHGVLEQRAASGERFYGLGARRAASLNLRGSSIETRQAFLLSSTGYGEYYPEKGEYKFDLGDTRRVVLPQARIEYCFYYGPTAKEIFEEHLGVIGPVERFETADLQVREPRRPRPEKGSWEMLGASVRRLLSGGLSAELIPEFDLTPYTEGDAALLARAVQVASLMPILRAPQEGAWREELLRRRERLAPYLLSYTKEVRDRGIPVIHPLEMDYGEDPAALNRLDEFMLGDELLVAPVLKQEGALKVYLPRGIWTEISSGEIYKGRREISIRPGADEIAMFAKNGTIVPLKPDRGEALELHYFPSLGAEFFLFEENDEEISQFHAAPASDVLRLEAESKADRIYEWVIHHTGRCRKVESGDGVELTRVAEQKELAPGRWYADAARKLLRIRIRSVAGGDEVVHVIFEQ